MKIFGRGMWQGINAGLDDRFRYGIRNGQLANREAMLKIAQDREQRAKDAYQRAIRADMAEKMVMARPEMLQELSQYMQQPGPRAGMDPKVQMLYQDLPASFMRSERDYMTPEQRLAYAAAVKRLSWKPLSRIADEQKVKNQYKTPTPKTAQMTVNGVPGVYAFNPKDPSSTPVKVGDLPPNRPFIQTQGNEFNQEMKLQKQYLANPVVASYQDLQQQLGMASEAMKELDRYNSLRNSGARLDPGSLAPVDQALIMVYNKTMDRQSVVRESEYARTPEDMALLNRIKGKVQKILSGGAGLTDAERMSLYRMITRYSSVLDRKYKKVRGSYQKIVDYYGLRPGALDDIVVSGDADVYQLPEGERVDAGGHRSGNTTNPTPPPRRDYIDPSTFELNSEQVELFNQIMRSLK